VIKQTGSGKGGNYNQTMQLLSNPLASSSFQQEDVLNHINCKSKEVTMGQR